MELTIQLGGDSSAWPLQLRVLTRSDRGDRAQNQDALAQRTMGDWLVCVLADGAGGHQGGEKAAQLAVDVFLKNFETMGTLNPAGLRAMVHRVNDSVLKAQREHPQLSDMHTTLCALVLNRRTSQAVCMHVGDSRIYHFRHSNLVSRTKDHSVEQWMRDQNRSVPVSGRHALFTALGEPAAQLQVDVSSCCAVAPGDWFLLCSDGLWEHFSDTELGLLGCSLRDSADCCAHIHQLAMSRANGRSDNLSSMLVFLAGGCHSSG